MPDDNINHALGMDASPAASGRDPAINAALRYKDGYRVARFVDTMGTAVKIFGAVVTVIILALCMSAMGGSRVDTIVAAIALLCSVAAGGLFFVLGVIVSALGQHLKATLDSAVHTSPFLDVPAKARAMSLE